LAVLNSKFDVLRGWPNGSAVAEDFVVGGYATHAHKAGTWVNLDAAIPTVATTDDAAGVSSRTQRPYLIIEGRDDLASPEVGKVTCLMGGGYVVRLDGAVTDSQYDESDAFVPGAPVHVSGSIIHLSAPGVLDGAAYDATDVATLNATSAVVGHVVRFDATNKILEIHVY
jgi:hypothetical protein